MTSSVVAPDPARSPRRRPTIKDVAEAAGTSRSTASRALTGHGYVAEPVRLRVQSVADALGYVPDAMARHLKQRVSRSVGVLVFDLRNSFYADLAAGASRAARAAGYTVMLADLGGGSTDEVEAIEAFVAMRVAGMVVTAGTGDVATYVQRHHIPLVEVDRRFAPETCDAVVVENRQGARAMTEHLLDLGHTRIALLIDETAWTTGSERFAGYSAALSARGLPVEADLVVSSGWDAVGAQATTAALLARPDRPTAVFAANNVLAEGAWLAAHEAGMRVPQDLSLVAFDDALWMTMVTPALTAVGQDAGALGAAAVTRLIERLGDADAPVRTVVLPAPVRVRGSTAGVPGR